MSGMKNDDLAYQVLDHIRNDPEHWNQATYFCGTRACFAGWALLLNAQNEGRQLDSVEMCNDPGRAAAKVLGWNWEDAGTVFGSMTRNFSELERLVKNVMNDDVQEADQR